MSTTRLFPPSRSRPSQTVSTPLSILDATCARFSDTGAVWLFDAPPPSADQDLDGPDGRNAALVARLRSSFVTTLDRFPQWAGQLAWALPRDGARRHTQRWGRCMLTYGGADDPGVEWRLVTHDGPLSAVLPPPADLAPNVREIGSFPQADLTSPSQLALYNLKDFEGLPCMAVQVNLFACGGYGVGVRLAHCVADAQSLMVFMHAWAATARSQSTAGAPSVSLFDDPVFDPQQLDERAAGNIDGAAPDPGLVEKARALPLHRFSWWDVDAPGYSPLFLGRTKNSMAPPAILAVTQPSPSTVAPWDTWDLTRPTSAALLHFSGDELARLRDRARHDVPDVAAVAATDLSRSDALLAHVFRLVTRARAPDVAPADRVFLNVTLDARRRVAPPLPATALGSPLFLAHVGAEAGAVRDGEMGLGALAAELRSTLCRFTPEAVAGLLHDAAYEVASQRLWLGFLGSRHLIVTSWQRLRLYDVDFLGGGVRPRYVHPIMSLADGIVIVLDAEAPDGGVDVALYLESDALSRLLQEWRQEPLVG